MQCPDCRQPLHREAKKCPCGWMLTSDVIGQPRMEQCEHCAARLIYPDKSHQVRGFDNRIIGRTKKYGYICRTCANKFEPPMFAAFREKHQGDEWGVLIEASRTVLSSDREECKYFMRYLKDLAERSGGTAKPLPYDKGRRYEHENPKTYATG